MLVFWSLATLMTVVAAAFVLVPLLRARAPAGPTSAESNLEVLRAQRREIEADVEAGTLPAEAREEALQDLVSRAATDLEADEGVVASSRKAWLPAAVVAIAIPAIAFGLYFAVGNPRAADPDFLAVASGTADDKQILAMVESLAAKVRERPDDAAGWGLLARSMAALGRFREAAEAYEHLLKLTPNDPQVLVDYADALGMVQGRTLAGRPRELVQQALRIDANHPKALALAGTAALDAGDFAAASRYWRTLAALLPPESPDAVEVKAILAEVEQRAGAAGKPLPQGAPSAARAPAAAAGKTITGSVAIAPEIAARVSGQETLFVFARADGGPRVPLAIVRARASDLPLKFALDDSQAMAPGMNISSAKAVRVEARISRSGDATPKSGDLVGSSVVVQPGARDVAVVVDRILP